MRRLRVAWLLATAIALAVVIARAEHLRRAARDEIARALAVGTGLQARVDTATFSLGPPAMRALGVTLQDAASGARLHAREMRVAGAMSDLFAGHLRARSVVATGVELELRSLSALARSLRAHAGAPPSKVVLNDVAIAADIDALGRLHLQHARLEFEPRGRSVSFELRCDAATLEGTRGALVLAKVIARGTASEDHASGALELASATVDHHSLAVPGSITFAIDRDRVTFEGALALGGNSGALAFTATVDAKDRNFELRLAPQQLGLRAAVAALAPQARLPFDATVEGRVVLAGTLDGARVDGTVAIELHDLAVAGEDASGARRLGQLALTADAQLRSDGVELERLRLEPGGGVLLGSARVGWDGSVAAQASSRDMALSSLSPLVGVALQGHGKVELTARGRLGAPTLEAGLELEDAAIAGYELGRVAAQFVLADEGRELRFSRAEATTRTRRLLARELRLRLDRGLSQLQAHLHLERCPIGDIYRVLGAKEDPLLARLDASTDGEAEIDFAREGRSGKLTLLLALGLRDAKLDGFGFEQGRLDAEIRLPDAARGLLAGSLELKRLALQADGGELRARGKVERGQSSFSVAFDALALDHLPWVREHMHALSARVRGRAELRGSGDAQHGDAQLALEALTLQGHALGEAHLVARLFGPGETIEPLAMNGASCVEGPRARATLPGNSAAWLVCGRGLANHLALDLALGAAPGRPVRGSIGLEGFDLGAFLPERAHGVHVQGSLSATLRFDSGELAAPGRLGLGLLVHRLAIGEGDLAFANPAPFELRTRDGALELSGARLEGKSLVVSLSAAGSLEHEPRLLFEGTATASLFSHASEPFVAALGDVAVRGSLRPGAQPALRIEAEPQDVLVRVADALSMRKLRGKVVIEGERVRVDELRTEVGGGTLIAKGEVVLHGTQVDRYDLALAAERVALEPLPRLEVTLDADTHLTWTRSAGPPMLTGGVHFGRLLYGRHVELPEALAALNRRERSATSGAVHDRIRFDLEVEHGEPLRVRNDALDLELEVSGESRKLHLVGSDRRFGAVGKLAVTRGRVLFHGDEFQVTRGEMELDDAQRLAPRFSLRAVAERRKFTDTNIVFFARGDRDAFDLQVRCEAATGAPDTPPFRCGYERDELRCDSFERLVKLWLCRPKTELSSAAPQR